MITNRSNNTVDLGKLIKKFKESYKNIYIFQFEEQVFIYHSIGRKDYRELVLNEELTNEDKEEILCSKCVLYPENYDFTNCEEAGLPTRLAEEITKNSYVSQEDRSKVLSYYRAEMFDVDNQLNCLVISAFPTLDLEEVENWDVPTACKYLSRAEWMLHNINGLPFKEVDAEPSTMYNAPDNNSYKAAVTEEVTDDLIKSTAPKRKTDHYGNPKVKEEQLEGNTSLSVQEQMLAGDKKSEPLTIEEYRKQKKAKKQELTPAKLKELQAKYPEIDWTHDEVKFHGTEGILNQPDVDDTPVALRPRNKRN